VAKISNQGRVQKLRHAIVPWQPTSSPGREMAAVLHPHRFCRTHFPPKFGHDFYCYLLIDQ
jgi:hypothetical protein